MNIQVYDKKYQQQLIEFILDIQLNEFQVPVTIEDQPDLLNIESFYCKKNGNFWIALEGEKMIGTIALIDIDNKQSCLRKMFVHKDYRGKEKRLGQLLLDVLISWCKEINITEIYLGTFDKLVAAQKFYLKNNFTIIAKNELPVNFPLMEVDNMFFKLSID